jgi:DNA-binding NarL/FixJ family response regulator
VGAASLETATFSIVIADDHPLYRTALRAAVQRVDASAVIVEVNTVADTLRAVAEHAPRLVCLDLSMPDSNGFSGLLALRHDHPTTPVVVVSGSESPGVAKRAVRFGASGFIPKSSSLETIGTALLAVFDGEIWLPSSAHGSEDVEDAAVSAILDRVTSLTPAQLRVLHGLREGLLNKQIAYEMQITEATVKAHLTAIYRKLGVQNRTQAALAAGYLSTESVEGASQPPPE